MKIIEIKALENGAHRNQSSDEIKNIPNGWAVIPDSLEIPNSFHFVNIIANNGVVLSLKSDEAAYNLAKEKEKREEEDFKNTKLVIQDDIDSMLVDQEYRLTLLEIFIETTA